MSVYQSCVLLLVSTLCGLLLHAAYLKLIFWPYSPKKYFGIKFLGILTSYQPKLAKFVATGLSKTYLNEASLEEKTKYDQLAVQLKPQIEGLVDTFLKDRLPTTFPMLFNLMGEKTLLKFKVVFMDEVESTMPALMKNAGNMLLNSFNPGEFIEKTIKEIPMLKIEKAFRQYAGKEVARFKWIGAGVGFLIGLVQSLVLAIVT